MQDFSTSHRNQDNTEYDQVSSLGGLVSPSRTLLIDRIPGCASSIKAAGPIMQELLSKKDWQGCAQLGKDIFSSMGITNPHVLACVRGSDVEAHIQSSYLRTAFGNIVEGYVHGTLRSDRRRNPKVADFLLVRLASDLTQFDETILRASDIAVMIEAKSPKYSVAEREFVLKEAVNMLESCITERWGMSEAMLTGVESCKVPQERDFRRASCAIGNLAKLHRGIAVLGTAYPHVIIEERLPETEHLDVRGPSGYSAREWHLERARDMIESLFEINGFMRELEECAEHIHDALSADQDFFTNESHRRGHQEAICRIVETAALISASQGDALLAEMLLCAASLFPESRQWFIERIKNEIDRL